MKIIKDIYNENSWLQIEICNEQGYFEGLIEIDMEGYGVEHTIEEATYQLKYDYKINITNEDIHKSDECFEREEIS